MVSFLGIAFDAHLQQNRIWWKKIQKGDVTGRTSEGRGKPNEPHWSASSSSPVKRFFESDPWWGIDTKQRQHLTLAEWGGVEGERGKTSQHCWSETPSQEGTQMRQQKGPPISGYVTLVLHLCFESHLEFLIAESVFASWARKYSMQVPSTVVRMNELIQESTLYIERMRRTAAVRKPVSPNPL
jgi:hypothetical protein